VTRWIRARRSTPVIAALLSLVLREPALAGNQVWTGNGPRAKSIEAIVPDPLNPQRMWAAAFGSGVWRSLDGGVTWAQFDVGLLNTYVRCVAPNPKHPDSLLCGTNDGAYGSTDGGMTWTEVLATTQSVRDITIHPRRTKTAYVSTYGLGIYKTVNNSWNQWATVNTGLANLNVRDVTPHPTRPETLLAATGTGGGVERSFNGGLTWAQVPDTTARSGAVEQIGFDRANPLLVYAATLNRGVLKSADGGNTWQFSNAGLWSLKCRSLVVVDSLRYLGTSNAGAFYTTLHDPSWHPIYVGLGSQTIDALFSAPGSWSTVWAGTDGAGMYRSYNRGAQWNPIDGGLLATFGFSLAVRPSTHVLYDGTGFGDQFWKSTDQGLTWTRATFLFSRDSERAVVPDPVASKIVYMTAYGAGVYRSVNDGKTWMRPDSTGRSAAPLGNVFVRSLVAYPGVIGRLFVGAGNGVWESTDRGVTWTVRNGGLPIPFSVRSLAVVPGVPPTLYAGDDLNGVYKSTNGGVSWTASRTGLTSLHIRDLLVDARSSQTLYAATDTGVYKSTNGGLLWLPSSTGLPAGGQARVLLQDIYPSTIFCAVWQVGVFYTLNGGANWLPLFGQGGLANLNIHSLALDGERRTLYVGTEAGMQSLSNYPFLPTDAESAPALQQMLAVWPSPLRSGPLHVSYVLKRSSDRVRIGIFDVAGRRVRALETGSTFAGANVLTWNGRNTRDVPVAAGLYFLRLESEEGTRTARVVVPAR
jgi:photosystem II stability/assembly factor-like uncharacterized protein